MSHSDRLGYPYGMEVGMRDTAFELSRRGYVVHELCGRDCTCGSPGKVPHQRGWNTGGVKSAKWIASRQWHGGIGVRCTPELLVVDCDVKGGDGVAEIEALFEANGGDWIPTVRTRSGGLHGWYQVPAEAEVAVNRKLAPNVDTRGGRGDTSGQVVVPPSDGYVWVDGLPSPIYELTVAPPWMLEALEPTPRAVEVEPTYQSETLEVGRDGFDAATGSYWERAVRDLSGHSPGGNGAVGRNQTLFALGLTARRLANADGYRRTPGMTAMMHEALRAARASGLRNPTPDLERQFRNGWNAGEGSAIWPRETSIRNGQARARERYLNGNA